mmetsp:Transcript_25642/g.56492  ORF Transcript_25642/g.56492 Transcript_25642/m.56492 type:complete len:258 (+) Transcript_25642:3979-4752(+)
MTNQLPRDPAGAALDEGACEAPPATLTESAPASAVGAGGRLARNWGKSRKVVYVRLTSCERMGDAVRKMLCNFFALDGRMTSAASCLSKAMVVLPVPDRPTTIAFPGAPAFFSSSLSRSPPMRSKSWRGSPVPAPGPMAHPRRGWSGNHRSCWRCGVYPLRDGSGVSSRATLEILSSALETFSARVLREPTASWKTRQGRCSLGGSSTHFRRRRSQSFTWAAFLATAMILARSITVPLVSKIRKAHTMERPPGRVVT